MGTGLWIYVINDITFPKMGEAPKVIAVDPTTNWMFERTPAPESWFKD